VTSPAASAKVPVTSDAAPSSGKKSKTHPPKSYDIVQGMERIIVMMEETPDLRKSSALNARCVALQDRPFRSAASQRRVHLTGGEVDPDPIWATATIWRPQGRISRPLRPSRRTVHLPQGCTACTPWLPATEEDRSGARRLAHHTGSHVSG
jgi:hypothetical protein